MDGLKIEIYLRVYEKLCSAERPLYICHLLCDAIREILGTHAIDDWRDDLSEAALFHGTISQLFPEFVELYDGAFWIKRGKFYTSDCPEGGWWEGGWVEPRKRIIEFILANRL